MEHFRGGVTIAYMTGYEAKVSIIFKKSMQSVTFLKNLFTLEEDFRIESCFL
jgi:hypothetical protein